MKTKEIIRSDEADIRRKFNALFPHLYVGVCFQTYRFIINIDGIKNVDKIEDKDMIEFVEQEHLVEDAWILPIDQLISFQTYLKSKGYKISYIFHEAYNRETYLEIVNL